MKDKCLIVNIAKLNTKGSSQGAALQRVLAKQLRAQPSSLLMILNAETLDDSGAAVMLSLIGAPSLRPMVYAGWFRSLLSASAVIAHSSMRALQLKSCRIQVD
jgi:hypothetical protein